MSNAKQDGAIDDAEPASSSVIAGFFGSIALGPLVLLGPAAVIGGSWAVRAAMAACGCLLLASSAVREGKHPRSARLGAALAIVGTSAALVPTWATRPAATLVCLIALLLGGRTVFGRRRSRLLMVQGGFGSGAALRRGSGIGALGTWAVWVASNAPRDRFLVAAVMWASLFAWMCAMWSALARFRRRQVLFGVGFLMTLALGYLLRAEPFWQATAPLGLSGVVALALRRTGLARTGHESIGETLLGHPDRLLVGTFAALSLAGGVVLSIPTASSHSAPLSGIDAFFTATSAVCVTGLITVDTSVDLSLFGQIVVLALIQVGGLGIMTFSTAFLWAVGGRMSLRQEGAVASLISIHEPGKLFVTARKIVVLTFVSEIVGAAVLAKQFAAAGDPLGQALWRGVFTSVSAFCNAGFALQSTSLIPFQTDAIVLHTVGVLVILGGLSPLATYAIVPLSLRTVAPISAQAKLSLLSAGVLLVAGFAFYLAFEWTASLSELSWVDKIHNAWFQSVTFRTAGFNSVDLTMIQPATLVLSLIWMFIGGSPGGTAGGVKTTTVAILFLSVVQLIRGRKTLEVFGKAISGETRARATAVVAIASTVITGALVSVLLTQSLSTEQAVFEVVSAVGTVGLSLGGTAELDGMGKFIIILCMFIGRVGGLSLLMFLSARRLVPSIGRPIEEVDVG